MLQSIEITATLAVPESPFHNLHWSSGLELSIDCFICERTGRTTRFELGAERAICSGDSRTGRHYTAARISVFDIDIGADQISLRAVVDYWWAPFHDAKRDVAATALTRESRSPWVRLHLGYHCPEHNASGAFSDQTNLVRPCPVPCEHCAVSIADRREVPRVRLLT
ncbi:hypothetical protein ACIBQ2_20780 [Micromonospora sediminimaris]|uniref:hypothetical protein n=1 Tax=Micromonospora sediminimaris TaxID=547162 RepID=UPI0037A3CD87